MKFKVVRTPIANDPSTVTQILVVETLPNGTQRIRDAPGRFEELEVPYINVVVIADFKMNWVQKTTCGPTQTAYKILIVPAQRREDSNDFGGGLQLQQHAHAEKNEYPRVNQPQAVMSTNNNHYQNEGYNNMNVSPGLTPPKFQPKFESDDMEEDIYESVSGSGHGNIQPPL